MNYPELILVGSATANAERRTFQKGDVAYPTFGVGVSDGREKTTFFPVAAFGRYGEAVAKHITKGRQVLVEGRVQVSGNGRTSVVADRISLGASTGAHVPAVREPQ